jgi:hypothetical protein
MSIAMTSLTARIASPPAICEKIRPRPLAQDKYGGLGYNRDLIGAAQALCFVRFGAGKSISTAEYDRAIGVPESGGPSRVMATGSKEVRSDVQI